MNLEKFCLQWNDFQDNIQSSYKQLRNDLELSDVTIACEDGQTIKAHKLIISSSSPILRDIITMNKHPHPLIYLRGVDAKKMNYIIDFMYYGEVNIFQEDLEEFLNLAEEFKLKGLHKTSFGENDVKIDFIDEFFSTSPGLNNVKEKKVAKFINLEQTDKTIHKRKYHLYDKSGEIVLAGNDKISMDTSGIDELDERINNMMEKQNNSWFCKICGKSDKNNGNIKNHIEVNHIAGIEYPCKICGKTCRSRKALHMHVFRTHNNKNIN